MFNALHRYNLAPTETVAVLGVGGLGHMAVQFAAKSGCNVVALSGSDSKKDEAAKLGAHEFIAMKGKEKLETSRLFDRLLVTIPSKPDWPILLPLLKPGASIHLLGVTDGNFEIPYMPLLLNGITVQGSVIGSRYIHRRMLAFAALHEIKPVLQKFKMDEESINDAMDRLEKGDIHFRGVFVN